jgi:hypothetical protein
MTMRYSHLSDAYRKTAVDGVVLGRANPDRDNGGELMVGAMHP